MKALSSKVEISILWAAAILASAILADSVLLSVVLLPVLAYMSVQALDRKQRCR